MKYTKPEVVSLDSAASAIQSSGQHVKPTGLQADTPFLNNFTINAYEADE